MPCRELVEVRGCEPRWHRYDRLEAVVNRDMVSYVTLLDREQAPRYVPVRGEWARAKTDRARS